MEATFWALVPPILAIIISLLTKEVNLSLIVGIIVGCGLFCSFNPFTTVTTMFDIMSNKVYGNMGVLIFIILLGMIVVSYIVSGFTESTLAGFVTGAVVLVGLMVFLKGYSSKDNKDNTPK